MRILILSNIAPYSIGGAEIQARLLAEQFIRRGHRVIVAGYAVASGRLPVTDVPGAEITTCYLPTIRTNRFTRAVSFFVSLGCLLIRRRNRDDIIYCRFVGESALVTALFKCLGVVQCPLVVCSESTGEIGEAAFIKTLPAVPLLISMLNRACSSINILSPNIAGELAALGIDPGLFTFIPNGVRLPPGKETAQRNPGRPRSILFAGRLVAQKGVADLLQAVRIIGEKGCAPMVNIVGDGPLMERLRDLARGLGIGSRVVFHGQVRPHDMVNHYLANDLLVLPSHCEGQGIVVAEAMSYGLPVIVTRSGGPEHIVDDRHALICPPGQPGALAAAMGKMLMMSDSQLAAMGRYGREKAAAQFDIETVADRFLEVFGHAVRR